MKETHLHAISVIIGAILVASGINHQEAHATGIDDIMKKIVEADSNISYLKNSNIDELSLGNISFKVKKIEEVLLEINEINDKNDDRLNKIYDQLKLEYKETLGKYHKDIKNHQKENGLTLNEKKLVTKIFQSKITFENVESQQNLEKITEKKIQKTIKESKIKKDYQKLINKIGEKLADEANGGKIQNIHHKLAIDEIMNSNKLELAAPAIDRIITQTNSDEKKERLNEIKAQIKGLLDTKEKQAKQVQIFALKDNTENADNNLINFNEKEIFSGVDEQIKQSLESRFEEANILNTIEPIFESELIHSLDEVGEISDDDDKQQEIKREKQREESREKNDKKKSLIIEKIVEKVETVEKVEKNELNEKEAKKKEKQKEKEDE